VDAEVAAEARRLVASLRATLEEWVEEGVCSFPPAPGPAAEPPRVAAEPAPARAPAVPAPPEPAAPGRPAGAAADAPAPALPGAEPRSLEDVRRELGDCQRCGLAAGRSRIVFGDGHPDADLMFIGEGPGQEEDRRGLPFVGRAGELLTQMIEKGLGIPRPEVYICNIVKCRPPNNRTPLADEVAACRPFLDGQIDAVRPRVIVALGKPATSLLLGRDVAITRVRGTWHHYRGTPVMPTLHPAYILRQYTPENRRLVWEDLKAAHARSRGEG
jgi:DNA polymerase